MCIIIINFYLLPLSLKVRDANIIETRYIATNEGVVEYMVDLQQRRMHPAIQMR
jgi:hypothetical protein